MRINLYAPISTYKSSKLIILSTLITISLDSADIVRRKFMLVTVMTYRVKSFYIP